VNGAGDCFPTAGRLVLADPELILCHGLVMGREGGTATPGERHWHAWAERTTRTVWPAGAYLNGVRIPAGGVVAEAVTCIDRSNGNDLEVPQVMFLRMGAVDAADVRRYTSAQAAELVQVTGHWGPWPEGAS